MSYFSRMIWSLAPLIFISGFVGCATFNMPFGNKIPKATAADPVVEILCLWQHGEGQDPDGVPCKGFTGQILFLSRQSSAPVQIEGEVRIYLFDDQGTVEEQTKPIHIFNFDNGSWAIHFAKTALGPTYTVFVPYTRKGTHDANCSLRVRLKPKKGPIVFSDFSNMQLNVNKRQQRGEDAKPISNEEMERLAAEAMASTLRRTTTISTVPNAKAADTMASTGTESAANPIQQAGYEVPETTTKVSNNNDRVQQLEATVQQLMKQIADGTSPAASISNKAEVEPAKLDDDTVQSSERLKLSPRRKKHRIGDEETRPSPPRRIAHPLDEDQPEPVRKLAPKEINQESSIDDPFGFDIDTSSSK